MSNDNHSLVSYIEILDTDTRSIEMHRIKYALVESRNKSKLLKSKKSAPFHFNVVENVGFTCV